METQPTTMIPPAFGPPSQASRQQDRPDTLNPADLLAVLKELAPPKRETPEPLYRPGYQKPTKPDPMKVRLTGQKLYNNARLWRQLIFTTLKWVRQDLSGMFPEDEIDRRMNKQEEYISTALSDERNLIISKGAALKPSFHKQHVLDQYRGYGQQLEDAAVWLRDMERFKHAVQGNRPLEIDEWDLFTDYGLYASRDVLSPYDYECPIDMRLMDPAQVHPVWGRAGLESVYRVFRDSSESIRAAYGEFTPEQMAELKKNTQAEIGDGTEFEITEYWDTWYRLVLVGDVVVLSAEHKYGDVPWTVQYGGHGEPMFTRALGHTVIGRASGKITSFDVGRGDERINKAVPYLYYRIKNFEIFEAVMGRVLTEFKKSVNPPTIRYRSDAAAEKPMNPLDASAGAQNDAMLGEEKIESLPTGNPQATNLVLGALNQDRQTGSAPPEMYGRMDKSNVTGVAQAGANDAGTHLLFPDTKAWEYALSQKYTRILRMWANFGYLAEYGSGTKRSVVIPAQKRGAGSPRAYEFSRDIVDKVGPQISVTFTKIDPRDWPAMIAAAGPGIQSGIFRASEIRTLALGVHDWEDHIQEWMEEQDIIALASNPDFQKLQMGASILQQIKENDGSPGIQEGYQRLYALWEKISSPPPPDQGQQQMPGGPPQPGGPQSGGGGPFPPPPGSTTIPPNPGVPGQMSYPALGPGQAPGGQGAPVGRPY